MYCMTTKNITHRCNTSFNSQRQSKKRNCWQRQCWGNRSSL